MMGRKYAAQAALRTEPGSPRGANMQGHAEKLGELKLETHNHKNVAVSGPLPETQKALLEFRVQTFLCLPVFVFQSERGGGALWLGKEKASSILSSAGVGFLPLLPTNLRIKANFFQARRQHSSAGGILSRQ